VLLAAAAVAGIWLWQKPDGFVKMEPARAPETIEATGEILGLAIGSSMAEARERLEAVSVPAEDESEAEEENERRTFWKLNGTEYDWIMAWAKADGRITRVRAVFRPEHGKAFHQIGNLQAAASVEPERVKWNLRTREGINFRLIAQGTQERAVSVYMFSLQQPSDDRAVRNSREDEK
jgi:hypothetical protein